MSKPWHGKNVVIVDDSSSVQLHLRRLFEELGMNVTAIAKNGCEALESVEQSLPEVVSLDLIMPEMDGVECYRKLHKRWPQLKVMILSWLGAEQKIIENLKEIIPANLFLAKPVTLDSLSQKLHVLYELSQPPGSISPQESRKDLSHPAINPNR